MADKNNAKKFALGAAVAGVAGYLAGVLTAPKSGKETRKDIADKAGEFKTEAEAQLHKAEAELRVLAAKAQVSRDKLTGRAKEELGSAMSKAKTAQTKSAEVLKAARAGKASHPELNAAIKQAKEAKAHLAKYLKA